MPRVPVYCQVKDIADWLRIDINANTDPTKSMVEEYIMANEDTIDRQTSHTWMSDKQVTEVFDVPKLWDWGQGMPLTPRKRNIKSFDEGQGDKLEIWDGANWVQKNVTGAGQTLHFQEISGITYIRGYLFTILRVKRFRITYRYGGDNESAISETETVPRDIQKACKLMTAIDILSTDFQMSQVAYGGEGNVDKQKVMDRWQKEIDSILWRHSEIVSIW